MNNIEKDIVKSICETLGQGHYPTPESMADYVRENMFAAMETYRNNGTLYDLDCLVALSAVLGYPVSFPLYKSLNAKYDSDLLALCENPSEARQTLFPLIANDLGIYKVEMAEYAVFERVVNVDERHFTAPVGLTYGQALEWYAANVGESSLYDSNEESCDVIDVRLKDGTELKK